VTDCPLLVRASSVKLRRADCPPGSGCEGPARPVYVIMTVLVTAPGGNWMLEPSPLVTVPPLGVMCLRPEALSMSG